MKKYLSRLSGPLLDRIDLFVEVAALEFEELSRRSAAGVLLRSQGRVDRARAVQRGATGTA